MDNIFYSSHRYFSLNVINANTSRLFKILKDAENSGLIEVKRVPQFTTTGKISKFWSFENEKKIYVRKK